MSHHNSRVMPPPRPAGRLSSSNSSRPLALAPGQSPSPSKLSVPPPPQSLQPLRPSLPPLRSSLSPPRPVSDSNLNGATEREQTSSVGHGLRRFRFSQLPTPTSRQQQRAASETPLAIPERPTYVRTQDLVDKAHLSEFPPLAPAGASVFRHEEETQIEMLEKDQSSRNPISNGVRTQTTSSSNNAAVNKNGALAFDRASPTRSASIDFRETSRQAANPPAPAQNYATQNSSKGSTGSRSTVDYKRDLRIVTTSLKSCLHFHQQIEYHPALLLFKTYGVLASGPETPDCDIAKKFGSHNVVIFELFERRSDSYLACYFHELERRLPAVCMGRTYSVVGQFLKEDRVGDFKVLTIAEATADNGIRQNLFNFNDQLLRKHFLN